MWEGAEGVGRARGVRRVRRAWSVRRVCGGCGRCGRVRAHAASAAPSSAIASTCTVLAMGSAPESAAYCSALYAGAPVEAEAMRRVSWRLVRERVYGQPIRAAGHRLLRIGTYRRAERLEERVEGLAGGQKVVVAVDDPGGQRHVVRLCASRCVALRNQDLRACNWWQNADDN